MEAPISRRYFAAEPHLSSELSEMDVYRKISLLQCVLISSSSFYHQVTSCDHSDILSNILEKFTIDGARYGYITDL